jgi:hypothetical protein
MEDRVREWYLAAVTPRIARDKNKEKTSERQLSSPQHCITYKVTSASKTLYYKLTSLIFFIFIIIFYSIIVLGGEEHLWMFWYHNWIHPSILLLYFPSPILRIVSTGLIFLFSYMSTKYFHYIHLPTYFPSPSHWYQPLDRTCFILLFCFFKKGIFVCLR